MPSNSVSYRNQDAITWVIIDNPPVNALGVAVRRDLMAALADAKADGAVKLVILRCEGRTFSAGADITEFGQPPLAPSIADVIEAIEGLGKPSIAAIQGTALGGGLEVAMACHHRVADAKAKLGLPEVSLGIIPGAGGTQRTPRLIGIENALNLMLSGRPLSADDALAQGLIDEIADGDLVEATAAFARRVIASGELPQLVRDRQDRLLEWRDRPTWFEDARRKAAANPTPASIGVVDALEAAATLPFEQGMVREGEIVRKLIDSPESTALRHYFFAERATAKVPGVDPAEKPADIGRVAVIGAGQMGSGIATALLEAGIAVTLIEQTAEGLADGLSRVRGNWANRVKRGALTGAEVDRRIASMITSTDFSVISDVDMVIEAVWENMALKKEIFSKLDAVAPAGAILGTNTSTLDVNEIASVTSRPEAVIGLHFFSPAHIMRLLEIVRGAKTSDRAIVTALALAKRLRKVPAVVGVCEGFVGNRIFAARDQQATQMLLEGATPARIDCALEGFGFAMGTFALYDMAGAIELGWRMRQESGVTDEIGDALYDRGRLGQRAGKGYYRYEPGNRKPLPDPEVDAIIADARARSGLVARSIDDQEIIERMIYPMINEAARILEEGIAIRASDIDVIWVTGYGWPMHKGGPAYYGDRLGLGHVRDRLLALRERHGEHFAPAALLERLAAEGGTLAAFARDGAHR